jgi:phage terminase Nu1 subunit (DNA packaging protein)
LKKEREVERKEREAEKKEKRAERAERVFLAEEQQEQKILKQKVAAEQAVSIILLKTNLDLIYCFLTRALTH